MRLRKSLKARCEVVRKGGKKRCAYEQTNGTSEKDGTDETAWVGVAVEAIGRTTVLGGAAGKNTTLWLTFPKSYYRMVDTENS